MSDKTSSRLTEELVRRHLESLQQGPRTLLTKPPIPPSGQSGQSETSPKDRDMFTRFLAGLEEGVGVGDAGEGAGVPGLLGYGAGTAATGGIGHIAAVIPKSAWKLLAKKLVQRQPHPQVKESLEYLEKKVPGVLSHATQVNISNTPGAFGNANSELEYRIADLAGQLMRSRSGGNINSTTAVDDYAAAINEIRSAMEKNLSPKRLDNLSKVYRINIDPSAHSDYWQLLNTVAHETTHGAQMARMGKKFQQDYENYETMKELWKDHSGFQPKPWDGNPLEESAWSTADKVTAKARQEFKERQRAAMLRGEK